MLRGEQTIDDLFIGIRRVVLLERGDLFGRGRQADQVEVEPANKRAAISFGCRRNTFFPQPCVDEVVNRIERLPFGDRRGHVAALRANLIPMRLPLRSIFNPLFDQRDLLIVQLLVEILRRHPLVDVVRSDAAEQLAFIQLARNNRVPAAVQFSEGTFLIIQPQTRLARPFIRPVAGEAIVREDRANVPVEVDFAGVQNCSDRQQNKSNKNTLINSH